MSNFGSLHNLVNYLCVCLALARKNNDDSPGTSIPAPPMTLSSLSDDLLQSLVAMQREAMHLEQQLPSLRDLLHSLESGSFFQHTPHEVIVPLGAHAFLVGELSASPSAASSTAPALLLGPSAAHAQQISVPQAIEHVKSLILQSTTRIESLRAHLQQLQQFSSSQLGAATAAATHSMDDVDMTDALPPPDPSELLPADSQVDEEGEEWAFSGEDHFLEWLKQLEDAERRGAPPPKPPSRPNSQQHQPPETRQPAMQQQSASISTSTTSRPSAPPQQSSMPRPPSNTVRATLGNVVERTVPPRSSGNI